MMLFFDNEGDEVGRSIAQGSKILALRYEGQPFIREDADGYALSLDAVLAEAELHQPQRTASDFVATTPTATTDIDLLLTEARYFAKLRLDDGHANGSYHGWLAVGAGYRRSYGDDLGLKLFDEFSRGAPKYKGYDDVAAVFKNINLDHDPAPTADTTRYRAKNRAVEILKVAAEVPTQDTPVAAAAIAEIAAKLPPNVSLMRSGGMPLAPNLSVSHSGKVDPATVMPQLVACAVRYLAGDWPTGLFDSLVAKFPALAESHRNGTRRWSTTGLRAVAAKGRNARSEPPRALDRVLDEIFKAALSAAERETLST